MLRHPLPAPERREHQHHADDRRFGDVPGPDRRHPDAHQERDRDGRGDREQSPGTVAQRVDDDQAEHGEEDDHDREDRDHRRRTGERADLVLAPSGRATCRRGASTRQRITKSCTAPPKITPAISHIVPGRKPNCAASVGTDQRPGAGDRREVMAVEHPPLRRHEVAPVVEPLGRRGPPPVETHHAIGDEPRVEAIRDDVGADARDDDPRRVDRLAARERDERKRDSPEDGDNDPDQYSSNSVHR